MTRSLMIFGQGAIRCHPWVHEGNEGARSWTIRSERIDDFDRALFGHIGFAISNAVRSFWFGLTASRRSARRPATTTRAASTASSIAIRRRWR